MKSAFLTLFFLIIIFIVLNSGALDVIRSSAFHYMSVGALVVVFIAAGLLIGFKPKENEIQQTDIHQEDSNEN